MKNQSPLTSYQSFSILTSLLCLIYVTLTLGASALTISNQYVNVKIDVPTDISQFAGVTLVNDFYFIGKAKSPTKTFDVKYEVTLTKKASDAGCVLVAPIPAANTKENITGGLIIPYTVERKVKGEKKIKGKVYFLPVEIKVNDTAKEDDDFVAVSKGTDDDLATDFSVKLTGTDGVTAELSVKPADGNIKFKDGVDEALELKSGKEVKTKLWGITPSSAQDTTLIQVTLNKDYKELAKLEENVTVFKGVKLDLKGNFYANCDTRDFGRRPWDERAIVKPTVSNGPNMLAFVRHNLSVLSDEEKKEYKKAVDQSVTFGYESAISFKDGDNEKIKLYKPWKDPLKVEIETITALTPEFNIPLDAIIGKQLECKKGYFEGKDGSEEIKDTLFEVAKYFELKQTKETEIEGEAVAEDPVLTEPEFEEQVKDTLKLHPKYKELLAFFTGRSWSLSIPDRWSELSKENFSWKNDSFTITKKGETSIATKALLASKEAGGKIKVRLGFTKWNEFKFQGILEKSYITTE